MKACHHAQVPGHLPYCTMALKERFKQKPCQAEKIFAFGPYFQGDATLWCGAACPRRHGLPAAPCTKKVQPCPAAAQAGCWGRVEVFELVDVCDLTAVEDSGGV